MLDLTQTRISIDSDDDALTAKVMAVIKAMKEQGVL